MGGGRRVGEGGEGWGAKGEGARRVGRGGGVAEGRRWGGARRVGVRRGGEGWVGGKRWGPKGGWWRSEGWVGRGGGGAKGGRGRSEGWGVFGARRRVGARRVGEPKISRFFFPSPTPIFMFFSLSGCLLVSFFLSLEVFHSFFLLGVLSWNFGGVSVGRDPQMCTFGLSG